MEHFRVCCQKRLSLWLRVPVEVLFEGDLGLVVEHDCGRLEFAFEPRKCRWQLSHRQAVETGDFDHLTKRARQLLT